MVAGKTPRNYVANAGGREKRKIEGANRVARPSFIFAPTTINADVC